MFLNPNLIVPVIAFLASATVAVAEIAFPNVRAGNTDWAATVLDFDNFDAADTSLGVALSREERVMFDGIDEIFGSFLEACSVIMANPDAYISEDAKRADLANLTHLRITMAVGGEMVFPYSFGLRIADGKCTDTISFAMPKLNERFSQHNGQDELFGVAHSWGLTKPEVTFTTGTQGKFIRAEVELLKNFGRKPSELSAMALCIHVLANLEQEINAPLVLIRPKNYSKINIDIVENLSSDSDAKRSVLGSASFDLKDGQCVG